MHGLKVTACRWHVDTKEDPFTREQRGAPVIRFELEVDVFPGTTSLSKIGAHAEAIASSPAGAIVALALIGKHPTSALDALRMWVERVRKCGAKGCRAPATGYWHERDEAAAGSCWACDREECNEWQRKRQRAIVVSRMRYRASYTGPAEKRAEALAVIQAVEDAAIREGIDTGKPHDETIIGRASPPLARSAARNAEAIRATLVLLEPERARAEDGVGPRRAHDEKPFRLEPSP